MSKQTLKSIAKRGMTLGAAFAVVAATVAQSVPAYADALNPLTDRSLTLSSSSPGWSYTDGSGNATYAPPNSGANGQKTGNTFSFKLSSTAAVKAFTLQYCTSPAGACTVPGNNAVNGTDTTSTSDLNVVTVPAESNGGVKSGTMEIPSGNFATVVNSSTGIVSAIPGYAGYSDGKPGGQTGIGGAAAAVPGNFVVYYKNGGSWVQSTGWQMQASTVATSRLGTNNYITLGNPSGSLAGTPGLEVKIVFFGTANNYITNPGDSAFFVRMNTYSAVAGDLYQEDTGVADPDPLVVDADDIIDGGVTVANVMNQSIWIQTKVLETMEFSVGTVDPNTISSTRPGETDDDGTGATGLSPLDLAYGLTDHTSQTKRKHGTCDTILGNIAPDQPTNVLKLGNSAMEYSLGTANTYSTHSYWRLSSNASAGATVYYSGHTLTNTVGDEITPVGNGNGVKAGPQAGMEQFGLALDNTFANLPATVNNDLLVSYAQEATYENGNDNGLTSIHGTVATDVAGNPSYHVPTLYPLQPETNYNDGTGNINGGSIDTAFAFDRTSDTIPVALASQNSQVVDCVTGKMRYIANIAATTPAGIYTTKVNYIAAPQY